MDISEAMRPWNAFKVPQTERGEVVGFVQSLKKYIVEV
jgi:hypothetical protein